MLKKFLISFCISIFVLYALFLILPFFLTGFVNSVDISNIVEDSCGFKLKTENIRILTTPKLTVGIKFGHFEVALPTGETFFTADNVQGELALLPLFIKQIKVDMVGAENPNLNLKIKKDGKFLIEDYIASSQDNEGEEVQMQTMSLPFGFKLSNHLPDIKISNYNISFIDIPTDKSYSIYGDTFVITDFIINKKVKISAKGKVQLEDREQFTYDVKILNKIMPNVDLNDLVFAQPQETETEIDFEINPIYIFKAIYKNQLTADIKTDINIGGDLENLSLSGNANVYNFTVAVDGKKLPAGNIDVNLKGNKIKLYTKLYTAESEITEILGNFKTGKTPNVDLNFKSNAKLKSIIDLFDSVAKSFDYNDLDTLSATGVLDADFSFKSDLKTITSSGYLKVPSASLTYKLYNISIDKIIADILFQNNEIDIKNISFSVLNQPLILKGTISHYAFADLSLIADKLQIKGLLLAAGQVAMLKENIVNSGTLSANVLLKGQLDKIVPNIKISLDNLNFKNIPSQTTVKFKNSKVDLSTDGKKADGILNISNMSIINPMAKIVVPAAKITIGKKDIVIDDTYLNLDNSRIDINGKISDYVSKNINFDITAKGNLLASDIKTMVPKEYRSEVYGKGSIPVSVAISGNDKTQDIKFNLASNPSNYLALLTVAQLQNKPVNIKGDIKISGDTLKFSDTGVFAAGNCVAYLKGNISDLYKTQKLNLNFALPSNISMVIPYFKNSKMEVGGNIDIIGSAANPYLKGNVAIPLINIPDMLLKMDNMNVNLNGYIAKGKGTLKKFVCGGIVAENLTSDFNLTNNVFYLKNMTGEAFSGKIKGDISYNILNGKTGIVLKGSDMDAEASINGSAGIKNALSGKLGFDANVTTHGDTDVLLMKNLNGKATFTISDGELGNIGRFDKMLLAQNIMANPILKAGVTSITSLSVIKNTSKFKTISGTLNFSNGWVNLSPVKTSGPSMAYYITGKYNLLNGTANLVILGRVSAEVVKLLGPLGDLSLSKLTSLIPNIGDSTVALVQAITTNPYGEKISEIPALSSGNTNYKDFKAQFNGGVESTSSVKSFRWLSVCDTSEIESMSIKTQVQNVKQAVQEAKQQQLDAAAKAFAEQRKQAQEANQELKNAAEGLKNLLKKPTYSSQQETLNESAEIQQGSAVPGEN